MVAADGLSVRRNKDILTFADPEQAGRGAAHGKPASGFGERSVHLHTGKNQAIVCNLPTGFDPFHIGNASGQVLNKVRRNRLLSRRYGQVGSGEAPRKTGSENGLVVRAVIMGKPGADKVGRPHWESASRSGPRRRDVENQEQGKESGQPSRFNCLVHCGGSTVGSGECSCRESRRF
jgi:hypothetical protein